MIQKMFSSPPRLMSFVAVAAASTALVDTHSEHVAGLTSEAHQRKMCIGPEQ